MGRVDEGKSLLQKTSSPSRLPPKTPHNQVKSRSPFLKKKPPWHVNLLRMWERNVLDCHSHLSKTLLFPWIWMSFDPRMDPSPPVWTYVGGLLTIEDEIPNELS